MDDRPLALVADDDRDIVELVRMRLEALDYEVVVAFDGRAALEAAGERVPALAVLDIGMPDLDGLEVARRLAADPRTADVPVIFLTARVTEAEVAVGFDAGAVDYIRKPFSGRQLAESVRRLRAESELRVVVEEQTALRRVAMAVAREALPRGVFALVAEEAGRSFHSDLGAVVRFLDDGKRAQTVGLWRAGRSVDVLPEGYLPLDGRSASALVAQTGEAVRIDDYGGVDDPSAAVLPRGLRCGLASPVRLGGGIWGTVVVARRQPEGFRTADMARLDRFADLVGTALANADARAQLATLASTDHLTGLPNQRSFQERLAQEVQRAERHSRSLSVVAFDLDHFKSINDRFGHQVGDRVLAEAASRLAGLVRTGEIVARVGGEEFAWILPETDGAQAFAAAERALTAMRGTPFETAGSVTASAGVCDLADARGGSELFRLADLALYWAKGHGRDRAFRYSPDTVSVLSSEELERTRERDQALAGIRALAIAVDAKDPTTQRHSERVAAMAARLALAAGWTPERADLLREAGLVHDVGKIGAPDAILLKPCRLTDDEYDQIKEHAATGARIISGVLSEEQTGWVRHHHERFDGDGYPDGLAGDAISVGAQLLALADAWDAMTGTRAYQESRTPEQAFVECVAQAGRQFSPLAIIALTSLHGAGVTVGDEVAAAT